MITFFASEALRFSLLNSVRMKLTVEEFWVEQYKDKTSHEFKQFASSLKSAVEKAYAEKNAEGTTILARVVEIR